MECCTSLATLNFEDSGIVEFALTSIARIQDRILIGANLVEIARQRDNATRRPRARVQTVATRIGGEINDHPGQGTLRAWRRFQQCHEMCATASSFSRHAAPQPPRFAAQRPTQILRTSSASSLGATSSWPIDGKCAPWIEGKRSSCVKCTGRK